MKHEQTEETFDQFLKRTNLSQNTRRSYVWSVAYFKNHYQSLSMENLLAYKEHLQVHFKTKTVNVRLQGINKYLEYSGRAQMKLHFLKEQQQSFLENVISNADYLFLKNQLKNQKNWSWYFLVWFLAATGARVSEVVQIKVEHIKIGYLDLYSKGDKQRRLYIPQLLRKEAAEWLKRSNRSSGYLFLNRFGKRITTRGIAAQLKVFADRYGIEKRVMHPHSFRHRFAINFLEKHKDIALLADLLGHENIETTRIYLRKTSEEQQSIVDEIVNW
ncbi:MAG: tyrosine-type recombinase/integrase [Treponema sp.]|nr:tyrosine-type recombinase/integrase [Treponema sp.]